MLARGPWAVAKTRTTIQHTANDIYRAFNRDIEEVLTIVRLKPLMKNIIKRYARAVVNAYLNAYNNIRSCTRYAMSRSSRIVLRLINAVVIIIDRRRKYYTILY